MGFVECKASCLLLCLVGISLIIVLEIDAEIVDGRQVPDDIKDAPSFLTDLLIFVVEQLVVDNLID